MYEQRKNYAVTRQLDCLVGQCLTTYSRSPYSFMATAIAASSHRSKEAVICSSFVLYVKTNGSKEQRKKFSGTEFLSSECSKDSSIANAVASMIPESSRPT